MKSPLNMIGVAFLIVASASQIAAQRPELVVQTGHSSWVNSVAFSADGQTLASGSSDHTIKLWEVATGRELRTLSGHSDLVLSVAFSADGRALASSSWDNTIKLWDVATGRELRTLGGHSHFVESVAFSADGQTLASGSNDKTIKLWEVATGRELRTLSGHSAIVESVAFSADRQTLASGSSDHTIKLWEVATGRELRTLSGHTAVVESVAFSADGQTLASGSSDHTIKLWEVAMGRELRTLSGHSGVVSVAFSADGQTLAAGTGDTTIKLWEVATGRELRTLSGNSASVHSVAFSADGQTLAAGTGNTTIILWEVATGRELRTLGGHSGLLKSVVAFSADGKLLASGSADATIKLWEVGTDRGLRTLGGHSDLVTSVAFTANGQTLASASRDNTIKLWEVATGRELRTLSGHSSSSSVNSLAFSTDGQTIAAGSRDNTIKLWEVTTGRELRTLSGHSYSVDSLAFSADGRTLASGSWDNTIKLWEVATGRELRTLKGHSLNIASVAFSAGRKTLASGSQDDTIKLWEVATGRELRTLSGHSDYVTSVAFSADGKTLASGSHDKTIKLWEVATGRELRTLSGHSNWVNSVAFSADGRFLFSGSVDTTINLWRVDTGELMASLIALDEKDWVVTTPDGLFDGSPAAWKQILWRFNNNTFDYAPVEAYFSDFYYPGLLTDIFGGKSPRAPSDIAQKDRRQPQLKLTLADAPPNATSTASDVGRNPTVRQGVRNTSLKIDVAASPADKDHKTRSGAQDVRLFRNGSLVKVWHGDVLKGKSTVTLETTIPIVAGENKLTAYAFNHDNIKSSDATLVVTGAESLERKGTAYVLAVGVNAYNNTNYNLKYAVPDAEDFSAEIKRQQDSLKKYERVQVIPLYDKDATKDNILKALGQLATKAQPEDAVIVYFSGHGTAARQRFYLIPHDLGYEGPRTKLSASDLKSILEHSISDRELEEAFEKIDAGQLLMVIDACNSGQALDSEEKRRGPMNSKGLAQLAYEKGMYILTAAQSYQAAWEASKLGHGYLTYALIEEGLKQGTADREPKNNEIVLREWLDYATERVPRLQEEKMKETPQVKDQQGRELEFVFVEGDEAIEDPTKRSVQRPRVFYRRELESLPMIVARPGAAAPARN